MGFIALREYIFYIIICKRIPRCMMLNVIYGVTPEPGLVIEWFVTNFSHIFLLWIQDYWVIDKWWIWVCGFWNHWFDSHPPLCLVLALSWWRSPWDDRNIGWPYMCACAGELDLRVRTCGTCRCWDNVVEEPNTEKVQLN